MIILQCKSEGYLQALPRQTIGEYCTALLHVSLTCSYSSTTTECLDDPHRLAQRQKQVDFGKNTVGYDIYVQTIPKCVVASVW